MEATPTINWQAILSALSAAGSIASIIGIWLTYRQLRQVRTVTEATDAAVKETHDQIKRVFSIVDLSKCTERIPQIRDDIHRYRFEIAYIRLRQLQDWIIEIGQVPEFKDFPIVTDLRQTTSLLGSSISTLQKKSYEAPEVQRQYDTDPILSTLDRLLEILSTFEAQLKHQKL